MATTEYAQNLEIHTAAYYGNIETIKSIMKIGAQSVNSRNIDGNTPLMMALYGPHKKLKLQVIDVLLDFEADVNLVNNKGDSALHAAVSGVVKDKVSKSCVEKLLESGADLRITNLKGKTATQLLYGEDCKKLLNFLLYYSDKKIMEEDNSSKSWKMSLTQQCSTLYDIVAKR